jgi:NAD(P)-dependent dehydrogenase (short-subunit alcohol dehydrogenase family)
MNKLCIVVGGSKGLGLSLVDQYRTEGYEVWDCSRSGKGAEHVYVDLSKRESAIDAIDRFFADKAKATYDEVLLIVNAATLTPIGPLSSSEPKTWWDHIDINLTMPISIFGRFQTHFNDASCKKVAAFVSSGAATGAKDGWSLYCATKAGVDHFLRTMALEQAPLKHPIECVSLNPGIMDTDMQAAIRQADESQFSQVERFRAFKTDGVLVSPSIVATNIFNALHKPFENGSTLNVGG